MNTALRSVSAGPDSIVVVSGVTGVKLRTIPASACGAPERMRSIAKPWANIR